MHLMQLTSHHINRYVTIIQCRLKLPATLVVAVTATHNYALDAAHESLHQPICEHYLMHDWSSAATLVVAVAAVHYCAIVATASVDM